MIENEPACMNVPATSNAVRSITEASGVERRSFPTNVPDTTRLLAADCEAPARSVAAVLGQSVVVGVKQPGEEVGAYIVAEVAYRPSLRLLGVLRPHLGQQPASQPIQRVAGQHLLSIDRYGHTP